VIRNSKVKLQAVGCDKKLTVKFNYKLYAVIRNSKVKLQALGCDKEPTVKLKYKLQAVIKKVVVKCHTTKTADCDKKLSEVKLQAADYDKSVCR
jgi:hypothetical protein